MRRKRLFQFQSATYSVATVAIALTTAIVATSCNRPLVNSADSDGTLVSTAEQDELIEPIGVRSGTFMEGAQSIQGTAQIVEDDGAFYLEFDPTFSVPSQEEGQVLLTPEAVPPSSYTDAPAESYLDLGRLSAAQGQQRYLIPPGTDVNGLQAVVILSPETAISMGYASLEPTPPVVGTVIEPIGSPEVVAEPVEPSELELSPVIVESPIAEPTETAEVPVAPAEVIEPVEILEEPAEEPAEIAQAVEEAEPVAPSAPVETAQAPEEPAEPEAAAETTEDTAPVVAPRALW